MRVITPQKESDETGAPCTYRKACNRDTVDDSVQSHKSRRKKGNWSHKLLLRQIQMNSNDKNAVVWQRILESSDSVQHIKTLGTRKHGSQANTRQGRRQEWQVPKLISPEEEKEKEEEKNKRERERCTHHQDHHHQPLHPYHGHRRMSASPAAPLSSSAGSKAASIPSSKNQNEKKPRGLG